MVILRGMCVFVVCFVPYFLHFCRCIRCSKKCRDLRINGSKKFGFKKKKKKETPQQVHLKETENPEEKKCNSTAGVLTKTEFYHCNDVLNITSGLWGF